MSESNFNFYAVIPAAEVGKTIRRQLTEYSGGGFVHSDRATGTVSYENAYADTGAVDQCFDAMVKLIENGDVPDFAFEVNNEPVDEYLGTIRMHVPGLPDFSGECDADGGVRVNASEVHALLDKATDLDSLHRDLAALTGRHHTAALHPQEKS